MVRTSPKVRFEGLASSSDCVYECSGLEMFCARSDAMNLDFVDPSSFANSKGTADDAPREEQEHKAPGEKKAADGCVSLPITAMDMRKGFNMIFLIRSDEACFGKETTATERGTAGGTVIYGARRAV